MFWGRLRACSVRGRPIHGAEASGGEGSQCTSRARGGGSRRRRAGRSPYPARVPGAVGGCGGHTCDAVRGGGDVLAVQPLTQCQVRAWGAVQRGTVGTGVRREKHVRTVRLLLLDLHSQTRVDDLRQSMCRAKHDLARSWGGGSSGRQCPEYIYSGSVHGHFSLYCTLLFCQRYTLPRQWRPCKCSALQIGSPKSSFELNRF